MTGVNMEALTLNQGLARKAARERVEQGLRRCGVADLPGSYTLTGIANIVLDELCRDEWLITDHRLRSVQEANWKDDNGESRAYEVYTEPDR